MKTHDMPKRNLVGQLIRMKSEYSDESFLDSWRVSNMRKERVITGILVFMLLVIALPNFHYAVTDKTERELLPYSKMDPSLLAFKQPIELLIRFNCPVESVGISQLERYLGDIDTQVFDATSITATLHPRDALWLSHLPIVQSITGIPQIATLTYYAKEDTDVVALQSAHSELDGDGIVIAFVASGVNWEHPEVSGRVLAHVDMSTDPCTVYTPPFPTPVGDYVGDHDTSMASIAVGSGDTPSYGAFIQGVAPAAEIVSINLESNILYDDPWLRAIHWIRDYGHLYGIDIVVIFTIKWWTDNGVSVQTQYANDDWGQAADELWTSKGLVVLAPTGADPTIHVVSPAAARHVLGVGLYQDTERGGPAYIGNNYMDLYTDLDLEKPQVVAPGDNILAASALYDPLDENSPIVVSVGGACPAAAFTAGLCALLLQDNSYLKYDMDNDGLPDVFDLLMASAEPLAGVADGYGLDETVGAHRVNALDAYNALHTDVSNYRYQSLNLGDYGTRNNEPLWGRDKYDYYKTYLSAGWTFTMEIDCDPDLSVYVKIFRYTTLKATHTIDIGRTKTIAYTATSSGWYYWEISLREHNLCESGDYYDIDYYLTS